MGPLDGIDREDRLAAVGFDARILSATHKDLEQCINDGRLARPLQPVGLAGGRECVRERFGMGGSGADGGEIEQGSVAPDVGSGNQIGVPDPQVSSPFGDYTPVTVDRSFTDVLPSLNLAYLVGNTALRIGAIGWDDEPATPSQVADMRSMLREAMAQGAIGVSSGLDYPPGWNRVSPPSTREPSALAGSIRLRIRTLAKVPRIITS